MTVLEALVQSLRNAATYNQHELAPPGVLLWPDEERLWVNCIEALRSAYTALWSLGEYAPDQATGPVAWLRYQLELHPGGELPILYLPGIGRQVFRSADQCPHEARHLYALQFQGQFWTHKNGKDWTPYGYLSSADGGLGLDVAGDRETRKAIQECLPALLEVELDLLRSGKLEAGDFRALVTKDPARTLLRWMADPNGVRHELATSGSKWPSFCAVCRDKYGVDPEKDGVLAAAELLSTGKGAWPLVWERFKEAPRAYPGIQKLLETMPPGNLFEDPNEYQPRANRKEEERLQTDLLALSQAPAKDALVRIKGLAAEHSPRAAWVWATLGESPLALAICHLRDLVEGVESSGTPTSWDALTDYYRSEGWKVDAAALRALDAARSTAAANAVAAALRAVYLPWLDKFSLLTQGLAGSYPTTGPQKCRALPVENGTIYLFADGLRLDLARRLEEKLRASGLVGEIVFRCDWAALPTVTATAKAAWQPLASSLGGPLDGVAFQAREKASGKSLIQARFRQLLADHGITFLEPSNLGAASGCAWTEFGSVDTYGHEQGVRLAWRVEEEIAGLRQRIADLLHTGWARVTVVTDHGWLLLPGGLPKTDLPAHLTTSRWGRCAAPAPGAQHGYPRTSWFWDAAEEVVLAPNVSCFMAGKEYAHGGLTPQEALIPTLTITANPSSGPATISVKELKWVGMRLNVILVGAEGLTLDVRAAIEDTSTSLAATPTSASADGLRSSLLIPDDDALGTTAYLVVVDQSGKAVFKHAVVIGQN